MLANHEPWTTHCWNARPAPVPEGERRVVQAVRRNMDKLDKQQVRKAAIET